jgi:hypothetical protein
MRAPGSAAATDCAAISCSVAGPRDIEGVWMPPVTAQVLMVFTASDLSP